MDHEDAIVLMAKHQLVQVSADIRVDLAAKTGHRPIIALLERARKEATAALVTLVLTDEPKEIADLQAKVRRYDDLVRWTRELVQEGLDAGRELEEGPHPFVQFMHLDPEDRQEIELEFGSQPEGTNDA